MRAVVRYATFDNSQQTVTAVIHLVPQAPPAICGVSDYARLVGAAMERHGSAQSWHVACGCRPSEVTSANERLVDVRGAASAESLWLAIEQARDKAGADSASLSIILHYSGYGYETSGAPEWLADALERRRVRFSAARLVTVFHELYATGVPWQRAFWTSGRQRRIAQRIAQASDEMMSNREASARWLEDVSHRPKGTVPSLPVPSNVGEPSALPPLESRPLRAVAFGRPGSKRFALSSGARRVAAWMHSLGLTELIDVGEPIEIDREAFAAHGIRVEQFGELPANEVSRLLAASRIGFVDYNPLYIEKSGVMAAYLAHGVIPVMRRRGGPLSECYALFDGAPPTADDLVRLSMSLRRFYARRRWQAHAQTLWQLAGGSGQAQVLGLAARLLSEVADE